VRSLVAVAALARIASADVTPLSALPSRLPRVETEGLTLPAKTLEYLDMGSSDSRDVRVHGPYCGVRILVEQWTAGAGDLDAERRYSEVDVSGPNPRFGLERLVERDGGAVLERTLVDASGVGVPIERARIALRAVGRIGDTIIYAYRRGDRVFVIAPSAGQNSVRFDSREPGSGRGVSRGSNCAFAITQLRVGGTSSQLGQITGNDARGCYLISASLTKLSRDPEPLLAIAARRCRG
jgi:hypothetical protein